MTTCPGRGSTFSVTLRLPKQPVDDARPPAPRQDLTGLRVLIVDDNRTNRTILQHQTSSWGMSTATAESGRQALEMLLVVDDNPVNQKVAMAMLARIGYRADVAANGAEAVDAQSRMHYGAILMDCQMPVVDGFDATTEIRRREGGSSHVPIIAMTAAAMKSDQEHCLAVGMDDYISKPVRLEVLEATLMRWVEQTHVQPPSAATTALTEPSELDVVDAAQLHELRDLVGGPDPDPYVSLADLFLDQLDVGLEALREAAHCEHHSALTSEAHRLKGAAANLGARALTALLVDIEELGRAGQTPGPDTLARLETESQRYRAAVAALRDGTASRRG